jgi:hypothetical protein
MKQSTRKKREKLTPHLVDYSSIYTEQDYASNDGMLTTVWGPPMWHVLHTMSFNYPVSPSEKQKKKYYGFIKSLLYVLPCGKCRENLKINFKKLPLSMKHLKSRQTLSRYVYDLHELINTMLGKKSGLSFDKVRERYEHFRSRCKTARNRIKKKILEKGCTEPLVGVKAKCVLQILPNSTKCDTFQIDKTCEKVRTNI